MADKNQREEVPSYSNIKFVDGYIETMDVLGKSYLMTDTPLSSGNHGKLFHFFDEEKSPKLHETKLTKLAEGVFQTTQPLFSSEQCDEMVSRLERVDGVFGLAQDEKSTLNRTSVIHSKPFADMVWESLKNDFVSQNQKFSMLGFDVNRGDWKLDGLHHGFTFHKHSKNWFYYSVRDQIEPQFCPNTDRRSLYTCLIFLTDQFDGGEVKFSLLPKNKDKTIDRRDKTIQQLAEEYGEAGVLQSITYKPKSGDVLLFKQDTIHKHNDLPRDTEHLKYFLKCDLMFERHGAEHFQNFIPDAELQDYKRCAHITMLIMYEEFSDYYRTLRDAMKYYVNDDDEDFPDERKMREDLQRCLNTRYHHPNDGGDSVVLNVPEEEIHLRRRELNATDQTKKENLRTSQAEQKSNGREVIIEDESCGDSQGETVSNQRVDSSFLPDTVWLEVLKGLSSNDCRNLIQVFPELKRNYRRMLNVSGIVPELIHHNGVTTEFTFKRSKLIEDNPEKMALVSTVYSIMLLGNSDRDKEYFIVFEPKRKRVYEITLEEILHCVFTGGKLPEGDLFAVRQQGADQKQPMRDFFYSVDRRYMALHYDMEFFGIDVNTEKKCSFEIIQNYESPQEELQKNYRSMSRILIESTLRTLTNWDRTFRLYKNSKKRDGESLEKFQHEFEPGLTSQETLNGISRFINDWRSEEDNTYLFEVVERKRNSSRSDYPSVLVVRKLDNPVEINRDDYVGEQVSWNLSNSCSTHVFNHFILNNKHLEKYRIEEDYEHAEKRDEDEDEDEEDEDEDENMDEDEKIGTKKGKWTWAAYDGNSHCVFMHERCINRKLMMEIIETKYRETEDFTVDHLRAKLPGCGKGNMYEFDIKLNRKPIDINSKSDLDLTYDFTVNEYTDIVAFPSIEHMHLAYVKEKDAIRLFTTFGNLMGF